MNKKESVSVLCKLTADANKKEEYILCAAIHFHDGNEYPHQPRNIEACFVICGRRHHNCFTTKHILSEGRIDNTQGFLTSRDRFVDRKEAGRIAFAAGQIDVPLLDVDGKEIILVSEDLY